MEYDLSPAIQAIRTLRFESHDYRDCHRLVWKPAQDCLDKLSHASPAKITCLHGPPYKIKKAAGTAADIYIVAADKKVLHLGTVIDRKRALHDFALFPEILKAFPDRVEEIKARGPMAIVRWWIMCSIPVDCVGLKHGDIKQGMQKYLGHFAPRLANVPLAWLAPSQQMQMDREIFRQAESTADLQTYRDRKRTFISDLFD